MADIASLSVEISFEERGLNNVTNQVKNFSRFIIESTGKAESTFNSLSEEAEIFAKKLVDIEKAFSFAGLDFRISEDQTGALKELDKAIRRLKQSLISGNEDTIIFFADLISGIAEFIDRVNNTAPALVQYASLILTIGTALFTITGVIGIAVGGITALATALGIGAATIGLVIVAITAVITAIVLLIQHWDFLVAAVQTAWNDYIVPIISTAAEAIAGALGAVGTFVENLFNSIVAFISEKWTNLINFLSENVPFVGGLIDRLTPDAEEVANSTIVKAIQNNENLKPTGGFLGLAGRNDLGPTTEAAKAMTKAAKDMKEPVEEATKSLQEMNTETEETADKADKASINIKFTSGSVKTYGGDTKGVLERVKDLNGGIGDQIDHLGLQKIALNESGNELTELEKKAKKAEEALEKFEDIEIDLLPESERLQIELSESLENIRKLGEEAGISQERIAQAQEQEIVRSSERITEALQKEEIERLQNSASFIDQIKGGFLDFFEQVENNGELISQFFANILSQMSQNFSDLFFNVIKGNFDDLKDLAGQAFDAILRSFLDLVSAIATRQIVISIGGLFGIGGAGGAASTAINGVGSGVGSAVVGGAGSSGLFSGVTGLGGTLGLGSSGLFGASGSFTALGNLVGLGGGIGPAGFGTTLLGAIPAIGAVLAAGAIAAFFIAGAFKKSPRLDLDFDTFRDEFGKTTGEAAKVLNFLDEDVFNNEIFGRSVSRKAGLGLGSELPNVIREAIEGQIFAIQDIINQLPSELAAQLNESLLNTSVDIESEIKGDRLLEFDETKKIAEKFQQFIEGDLQARFIFSIREFFVGAFESLGVLGDSAQSFVDQQFEEFQNLSGREARAEFGQEFLAGFQTLVDAYNVLNDNGVDSIGATVSSVQNLARTLGFDAVPSIDELDRGLEELISAAELDPDVIQDYLDLRAAILQVQSAILSSISSIIGNISSLNSTIVSIGGSAVDLTGFINQGLDASLGILGQDGLSLDDQEAVLDQALGFANQLLAEEQAAFERAQQAAQKAAEARAEAQRAAVQSQIDGLEREKKLIDENFDARLEALEEELRIAEEFARLNESILQTLDSIIFSSDSVFTAIERVGLAQSEIAGLQSELAGTSDPERQAEIAGQLEQAFDKLFGLAGEAFGVNSPEFVAIFDQVTGGLQDLADFTEGRTRSIEEINAEIEALNLERNQILENIDARIDAAQERLSSIQAENVQATFQASDRVRETLEFLRDEYLRIFEERMAQLDEVTAEGFETELSALSALVTVEEDSLIALRNIEAILSGAASFARGSGGIVDFGNGTLAFLHGREAVVPESQITPINEFSGALGDMNVNLNVNVNGGSDAAVLTVSNEIENMLVRSIRQGGKLRSAIQDAGARRMN